MEDIIIVRMNEQDRDIIKQRMIREVLVNGSSVRTLSVNFSLSTQTIYSWLRQDARFKKGYDGAKDQYYKELIDTSLNRLALGVETIEETREFIEIDDTDSEKVVKVRRTTKQGIPNINAITKLANRYTQGEYDNDSDTGNITIRITQKDRSLTIEERRKVLEEDKSLTIGTAIEVDANDIRELEGVSIVPPTSGE